MNYYAGVDIGSTSIKVVLIDDQENLLAHSTSPTGSHFHRNALMALKMLQEENGLSGVEPAYLVSTGYGRKLMKEADESVSEITANAIGAYHTGSGRGNVRTIINIGGQDLKVIYLEDDGHVSNFVMNDKCAAGTGRFLEMTSRNLEVDVDELGALHSLASGTPVTINSTCTVFAESEIISLLAHGHERERIVAGIHYSIARRVVRLAARFGVEDVVFFDGGTALNSGLVAALEDELMRPVFVPDSPQITTALGAALQACEAHAFSQKGEARA